MKYSLLSFFIFVSTNLFGVVDVELVNFCDKDVAWSFEYEIQELDNFQGDSTTIFNTVGWFNVAPNHRKVIQLAMTPKYFVAHVEGRPMNKSFDVGQPDVKPFCLNEHLPYHYATTYSGHGKDFKRDLHECQRTLPQKAHEQGFTISGFRKSGTNTYTACEKQN